MTRTNKFKTGGLALLLLLAATSSMSQPNGDPKFSAVIYAANPRYVDVVVSTMDMASNLVARDVKIDVQMFGDGNVRLGNDRLDFTTQDMPALVAGHVYRSFFRHSSPDATGAAALRMTSSLNAQGVVHAFRFVRGPSPGLDVPDDAIVLTDPPSGRKPHAAKKKAAKHPQGEQ